MNTELEKLANIIEAMNTFHAQLLLDEYNDYADQVAILREELFWLYHSMSMEDE